MGSVPEPQQPAGREKERERLAAILREVPVDFRILGKTLLHAALVGVLAGLLGVGFFAALENVQTALLGGLAGFEPLRAAGEGVGGLHAKAPFRLWVLALLPAAGGLITGLIAWKWAPEVKGGGGDAYIDAFHNQHGRVRRRVIWAKALASVATLGTGGSGGREGPTMQIGGAIGSFIGGLLRVGPRERRMLLVAGVAAGVSAVFRTPLGAALLAVEVLYKDDFEAEALVPAVLASVIAYSVVISILGEATLFAHAPRYPFIPAHLPYYALLAVSISAIAAFFVSMLHTVERWRERLPGPIWMQPAFGGLALGATYYLFHSLVLPNFAEPGSSVGVLGGTYGAAQVAITGADWLPDGWTGARLLLILCFAKLVAASFTIGSGGSAGDFAPSIVIGGLFGGAFGRTVALMSEDPRLDAGAFALVGMGAFYGGLANVPLSALVLVCELAHSYDLLVPLMLSVGITFVALRGRRLYRMQVNSRRDSPAHRREVSYEERFARTMDAMVLARTNLVRLAPETPGSEIVRLCTAGGSQDVFPVLAADGKVIGLVTAEELRLLSVSPEAMPLVVAREIMRKPVSVRMRDQVRTAGALLLEHGLREIPVVDDAGALIGIVDEADIARVLLEPVPPA